MLGNYGRSVILLLTLAVAGAAALGVALRAADPLSTSVIPAEDPYTHLALTREHLRDGKLEGFANPQTYPPGLHAVLATATVYSGIDLAPIVRLGPPVFGLVGIVGVALLLYRLDGAAAAGVGAVAYAVMPEIIFRQGMMSPTALDLALLPYALLGLVETVRGRLAWVAPTALLLSFFVISHPWLFGILGLTAAAFLLLALLLPWAGLPRMDPRGLAAGLALLGVCGGLALSGCWGACGPGVAQAVEGGQPDADMKALFDRVSGAVVATGILGGILLALARRPLGRGLAASRPVPLPAGVAAAALLVGGAAWAAHRAMGIGLPAHVNPDTMAGMTLLWLALLGLAAAPFARHPGAHIGAALAAATFPFTIFNPMDSEYWPHRTAAYLGIAVCILAGVAAGAGARLAAAAWQRAARRRAAAGSARPAAPWRAAIVPGLLVGTLLMATLVSAAPARYPGWYRLYDECEDAALHDIAAQASADADLVVVTGSWQSKLVIASAADGAERIWFVSNLLRTEKARQDMLAFSDGTDRPVLLVVDRHAYPAGGDPPSLSSPDWQPAGAWDCPSPVTAHLHTPT